MMTGPTSSGAALNNKLYIDANGRNGPDSLIYGDQSDTSGSNLLYFNGVVGIHDEAGTGTGEIRFYDSNDRSGGDYVAIKAPSNIADNAEYTLTLPNAAPSSNNMVLQSTTGGVLSWTSISGSGATGTFPRY